jgi:hypothetical protein
MLTSEILTCFFNSGRSVLQSKATHIYCYLDQVSLKDIPMFSITLGADWDVSALEVSNFQKHSVVPAYWLLNELIDRSYSGVFICYFIPVTGIKLLVCWFESFKKDTTLCKSKGITSTSSTLLPLTLIVC